MSRSSTPDLAAAACIGGGNVGRAWAIVFARAGVETRVFDPSQDQLDASQAQLAQNVDALARHDLIDSPDELLSQITWSSDLDAVLDGAEWVQESVPEDVALKRRTFADLAAKTSDATILASSTSELLPSSFLEETPAAARALVAHPINPPYLLPLVELCPSSATAPETLTRAEACLTSLGMAPVTLTREVRGFLLNRLQAAVVGEALHLVAEGYCSPQAIEDVMTKGLGRRWAFLGPFTTSHLNASGGYLDYMKVFAPVYRRMVADLKPAHPWTDDLFGAIEAQLADNIPSKAVPEAQAWRDERLMALTQHLGQQKDFR